MASIKKLFTTGEMANICGVKKQTFFHYDDIGLLKPEYTNENGYRYYSVQQTYIFSVIEMLKEMGMSLAEINDFFHSKSPKEAIKLLTEKEQMMVQKIEKLQRLQKIIQNKKKQIEEALLIDFDQFTIEEMEAEHFVLSDNILKYSYKEYRKTTIAFIQHTKKKEIDIGYPIGGLIRQEQIETGHYSMYSHFYTRVNQHDLADPFIKEAGAYVIGYHKGSYIEIKKTYEKIKSFLKIEGYHICGYGFEEYIMDEVIVSGIDNYVIKIMIHVKAS